MVISLKRIRFYIIGLFILSASAAVFIFIYKVPSSIHNIPSSSMASGSKTSQLVAGGFLCTGNEPESEESGYTGSSDLLDITDDINSASDGLYEISDNDAAVMNNNSRNSSERFQRPSKQPALKLKYSAKDFIDGSEQSPYIKTNFSKPEDVIQAYFAILRDASNMAGYYGGCGTIGLATGPYSYAYELLSSETREAISQNKFEESFEGIGHITLLKLYPVYQPPDTPDNIKYYMVETEVITGPPYNENNNNYPQPSYFVYYYGLITTENTPLEGWKIKSVKYLPEDFLCHPYHHWDFEAQSLVEIVYKNWYGLIDEIEKVENKDSFIQVYAAGSGNKYRFDFVRLTNGDDVLLHENVLENGQWKEVDLLKPEHQYYKLSVLNPRISANSE